MVSLCCGYWCYLSVYTKTKDQWIIIVVSKIIEYLLIIFIYSNSKFVDICKNVDNECQYIRTHTNEKPSYISFTILPCCSKEKIPQLNCKSESFESISFWCNHQLCFTIVHFKIKNAISSVGYSLYPLRRPKFLVYNSKMWEICKFK